MQNRLALTFILATVLIDAIGIGIIFPVMPDLIGEVSGGTLADAALWGGLLATSYAVMQFLFGPIVGSLSDRFGRRPVLLVSLFVMAIDYLVMALAQSIWLLLAARIASGIAAATYATAIAYIADITPAEERGRRFGLIGACFGVGFILGPLLGGFLAEFGTRAPFLAAGALALANMLFGLLVLPETVVAAARRPFSLMRSSPLTALLAVMRLPGLTRVLVCYLILAVAMNVYPAVWSYFGQARFGWDARMIGISLAVYGLAFALGQALLIGPLIRRFGEHRAAAYGMWVDITTLAALGVVTSGTAALVITPFTALGGVVTPALQAIASRAAPANAQGEVQGVLASLNAIALVISPLLMTGTFSWFTGPNAPLFLPGAPFLLASALMLVCVAILTGRARVGAG